MEVHRTCRLANEPKVPWVCVVRADKVVKSNWPPLTDSWTAYGRYLQRGGRMLQDTLDCENDAYGILMRAWDADPDRRPTFADLKQEFRALLKADADRDTNAQAQTLKARTSRRQNKARPGANANASVQDGMGPVGQRPRSMSVGVVEFDFMNQLLPEHVKGQ